MLNQNERAHVLAALLRKDYGAFASAVEKTHNLPRMTKVRLLAIVLRDQDDPAALDVEEILRLVSGPRA